MINCRWNDLGVYQSTSFTRLWYNQDMNIPRLWLILTSSTNYLRCLSERKKIHILDFYLRCSTIFDIELLSWLYEKNLYLFPTMINLNLEREVSELPKKFPWYLSSKYPKHKTPFNRNYSKLTKGTVLNRKKGRDLTRNYELDENKTLC